MTQATSKQQESFIYQLFKEYWFQTNEDPELRAYQKDRWFYLINLVFLEIALATLTFFATISFGALMNAIEIGSTSLFMYHASILMGFLITVIVTFTMIKFCAKQSADLWRSYILKSETAKLCKLENLKKIDQRDKSVNMNSPGTLARTLGESVADLFEVTSTIITAFIQFVPCMLILFMISPPLPWINLLICCSLLFVCYHIAKIMNHSQAQYTSIENQYLSESEEVYANANTISMQPELLNSKKEALFGKVDSSKQSRRNYRIKKAIFDFFTELSEKIVLYGPYLIFGYFAIQAEMTMAAFTLMASTFIQASSSLMKINQIQTLVVKASAIQEQYNDYRNLLESEVSPNITRQFNDHSNIQFNCRVLDLDTTKPYKIKITDQNGSLECEKFDTKTLSWVKISAKDLDGHYCLTDTPYQFNAKQLETLPTDEPIIFSKDFNYRMNLDDLRVEKGSKVLLRGQAGLGKSLLLKVLSGNCTLGYGNVALPKPKQIIHIPQESSIDFADTWRNQLMASIPNNERHTIDDDTMLSLLNEYIPERNITSLDETIEQLSGGQKQKFVLCRLLLRSSENIKLITLDEPFGANAANVEQAYLETIYKKFNESIIITITHSNLETADGQKIISLHDTLLELKNNRRRANGSPSPTSLTHIRGLCDHSLFSKKEAPIIDLEQSKYQSAKQPASLFSSLL